jgi:hypothetical protein
MIDGERFKVVRRGDFNRLDRLKKRASRVSDGPRREAIAQTQPETATL